MTQSSNVDELIAVILSLSMTLTTAAIAQTPSFAWFGPESTENYGVSADGVYVTGRHYPGVGGSRAFRGTVAGGLQNLGVLYGNHEFSVGSGISGDGSVVVGWSGQGGTPGIGTTRGFKWSSGGISDLGTLAGHNYSVADEVSADGSVVAGVSGVQSAVTTTFRAVIWNPGIQNLGVLPGTSYSHAYGISDDGSTVVGFSAGPGTSIPFRWRSDIGMQSLGPGIGTALAASADGSVIVGDINAQAFRWTEVTGIQLLGVLPGHLHSSATGVSADGSVVIGYCSGGGNTTAFRWVVGGQMQSVGNALLACGLAVDACWACTFAYDVSADGMTIVGDGCYTAASPDVCTAWIATIPLDSDGDGLLDPWESEFGGLDGDGNGIIDLNLYSLGARWNHKDLFVEVDAMIGVSLMPQAQSMLMQAFATAPINAGLGGVSNPDGTPGINLHLVDVDVDPVLPEDTSFCTNSCWPDSFEGIKAMHFGNPFDSPASKSAKAIAFRYCLIVKSLIHPLPPPLEPEGYGGCGYVPGSDFVVAFQGYDEPTIQASTFMHELGHTLGLHHGGADSVEGKPNYVSVMNYILGQPSQFSLDFWRLDYSRSNLGTINEAALDELVGIPAPPGFKGLDVFMAFGFDDSRGVRRYANAYLNNTPINWDHDSIPGESGSAVANNDVNYAGPDCPIGALTTPSPSEELVGHDDWSNIQLGIPSARNIAGQGTLPLGEPPPAPVLIAWLNANVPAPCVADINSSGVVDVDDLIAVILGWGACPKPPTPCLADIDNSRTVDVDDLIAVILAWGACW